MQNEYSTINEQYEEEIFICEKIQKIWTVNKDETDN